MSPPSVLSLGPVQVDLDRHEVRRGTVIALTPTEVSLLRYLAERPGVAVGRDELLEQVWGWKAGLRTRAVFHAVQRLRKKIEPDPDAPRFLLAVFGVGYRLELAAERPSDLVGRHAEWDALEAASGARFVAVVGPGGIGKSTLARAWAQARSGGVVALRGEGDAAVVGVTLAQAVGVGAAPDPVALLPTALAGRLVLLDDVGAGAATALPAWFAAGRCLYTARAPLGLEGEVVVEVGPLPLPTRDDQVDEASPAVRLFLEAARRARPDVAFGAADASLVHGVVRALDGYPLALELAAARLRTLGLADLHARTEATGAPALEVTLERTWAATRPEDRRALSAFAVFRGTFSLAAAEHVAGPGAADALERLVDLRLVQVTEPTEAPREARYSLLAPIRAFAAERGSDPGAVHRWAAWCARAADAREALAGPDGLLVRRRLLRDLPDLAAAAGWALRQAPELARGCVLALHHAVSLEGPYPPSVAHVEELLRRDDAPVVRLAAGRGRDWVGAPGADALLRSVIDDPELGAIARDDLGTWCVRQGRAAEAEGLLRAAVAGLADRPPLALLARQHLSWALRLLGRLEEARHELLAVRAALASTDHWLDAAVALDLGMVAVSEGRFDRAEVLLSDARVRLEAQGATRRTAQCRQQLGVVAMAAGRWTDAEPHLRAHLAAQRALGDRRVEAGAHTNLGIVLMKLGRPDEAEAELELAAALSAAVGDRRGEGFARMNLGCALSERGVPDRARRELAAAVDAGRALRNPRLLAPALAELAALSPPEVAGALADEAVSVSAPLDPALRGLALCARATARPERRGEDLAAIDALLTSLPEPARVELAARRSRLGP